MYPGARHELLVETNHQEVFEDIGSWLEKHLA
jgi:alpha-beta hydrolase superfamily lysophospholipase